MTEYDLLVIGAGSGGTRAARWAATNYKVKVACVELPFNLISSKEYGGAGGTCVLRGCVPKKLMWLASSFHSQMEDAVGFGWADITQEMVQKFSFQKFMEAKNKEVERLHKIYIKLLDGAEVDKYEGRASLVDDHTAKVKLSDGKDTQLKFKNLIVATGNHSIMVPIPGKEYAINSDQILSLPDRPKKLVVIGGGYIGVEFAGIYNNFGTEVHVLYRSELPLKVFDTDCQIQVAENLTQAGVNLHPYSKIVKIDKISDNHFVVVGEDTKTGEKFNLEADVVLGAVGRKPNTDDLNLEACGVKLQEKSGAVLVNQHQQTNVPHIYGVGDVTNRLQLTPMALAEGMVVVNHVFGPPKDHKAIQVKSEDGATGDWYVGIGPTLSDHRLVATTVFAQPPLSTVGVTEEQAQKDFSGNIDIYTTKFSNMKATLSPRVNKVYMKMIVHQETDRVIGVHMVGDDAPEIMQTVGVALKAKATKLNFDQTIAIHPTTAEELVTMRSKSRTLVGQGKLTPDSLTD